MFRSTGVEAWRVLLRPPYRAPARYEMWQSCLTIEGSSDRGIRICGPDKTRES